MRWSETLIPTLRDDPQEAEIVSHKLMLRAGLIRKLAGGLYTFLPLGLRALRKVEAIVREEMDRAGAIEILMPALQPREIWDQSHRYETMGDVMFRLKDRQDRDLVLGPTHEEVVTDLAAHEIRSYRQAGKTLYQIQFKFRDEIRPRFGLMRAKEFLMKDAYSFDADGDQADASYKAMYEAYTRIFDRCGLRTKIVEADTGAMGGKSSHEFMVLADAGEDGLVECDTCAYAANLERAERAFPDAERLQAEPRAPGAPPEEVLTPGCRTIQQVSDFLKCAPDRLVKTLIYLVDGKPLAVMVPGDREVNGIKLAHALQAGSVALADDAAVTAATGAPVGFAGPIGLRVDAVADLSLKGRAGLASGANKAETHVLNIDMARDARIAGYHDLCFARQGDPCPRCAGRLVEKRGIEVGHVFKLGTKYSDLFDASYLDEEGRKQTLIMGCYGIGVTRALQAVIEQSHDAKGILWPMNVAPYRVVILVMNAAHQPSMLAAEALMRDLNERGVDVLLDDRDERPGVKFNDADLIGFPVRVVVGERGLAKQSIEVKLRTQDKPVLIDIGEAGGQLAAMAAQ